MKDNPLVISSLGNPRVKNVVKLRQRSHRDDMGLMIVEGYREILRALDNAHFPKELFYCRDLFQGENNDALLDRSREAGTELVDCSVPVFKKISYRDRPDGLLALAPQVHFSLQDLDLGDSPLVIVAEAIEKPGNLGTILRSADAAGVDAVIVCDRCTDINNPNVVRASIGTIFSLPVVEATSREAQDWLRQKDMKILAATPHASNLYSETDMTAATAIVVGTEQYGLSKTWMEQADYKVRIPMLGQSDSLNVASATTILLYEAIRQRGHSR
ncbi:MAG: RNA methyltransferase [Kiritimatiellia bacterium]|jgi:TrmH family RNA methyltransferase|nr:RNA methyltransferase [Kiritimatiellia bacterium]MDP6848718.1 RNA methyltransferase [Kiritimatiellia bacterium]